MDASDDKFRFVGIAKDSSSVVTPVIIGTLVNLPAACKVDGGANTNVPSTTGE